MSRHTERKVVQLERHSYEDFINDMATDDSKSARGWHAQCWVSEFPEGI